MPTTEEPINGDLFRQAMIEDSNLEMDWLWLATQVRSLLRGATTPASWYQPSSRTAGADSGSPSLGKDSFL